MGKFPRESGLCDTVDSTEGRRGRGRSHWMDGWIHHRYRRDSVTTREEIAELQGTDAGVGLVKRWVEAGGEPQREELMLADVILMLSPIVL